MAQLLGVIPSVGIEYHEWRARRWPVPDLTVGAVMRCELSSVTDRSGF